MGIVSVFRLRKHESGLHTLYKIIFKYFIANLLLKDYSKFAIIFLRKVILCTKLNFMKTKMESLK